MYRSKLSNGIEVFLMEDHFTDSVCIQGWFGVGSMMEAPDERGMSHLIEHMLFKGTTKLATGDFAKIIEACGGSVNAYTTFDRTVYYLNIISKFADKGIDLLSDCLFHSAFDAGELTKEKEVVIEEIKRGRDDPGSLLGYEMFAQCYQGSEAGRPIIGSDELVKGFSREKVLSYYNRWYVSENLRLIVVGNFERTAMLRKIEETFGREPCKAPPRVDLHRGSFPQKLTVSVLKGDYQQPRLQIAFPAPALEDADSAPLDIASFALGAGDMSRLSRRLRDEQELVAHAGAGVYSPAFGGIFTLSVVSPLDTLLPSITGVIKETFLMRQEEPISEQELQRAKTNLKADKYYQEETLEGLAKTYGFGLTTNYKTFFEDVYLAIVDKTDALSVSSALERWINPEQMVVVAMLPQDCTIEAEDIKTAVKLGIDQAASTGNEKTLLSGAEALGASKHTATEVAKRVLLDCGIELMYRQHQDSKLFNLVAVTEGGTRAESKAEEGLFNVMAGMLVQATEEKSHDELMETIEGHAGEIEGFSGKDSFGVSVSCLGQDWLHYVDLFGEVLLKPVFPKQQWQTLKRQCLEAIKRREDSPSALAIGAFQEMMFSDHPYSFLTMGRKETIDKFDEKQLMTSFLNFRDKGRWVISVVGSVPEKALVDKLNQVLKGWVPSNQVRRMPTDQQLPAIPKKQIRHLPKDREQSHIIYGFRGLDWADADRPALDVLNKILGGQGGRLFINLRDIKSLAYSVSPIVSYGVKPWAVGSYIACAPDKVDEAIAGLKQEMLALLDQAPSLEECEIAKNYIVGNHELGMQRGSSQAMTMALMELYGVGYDDFKTYPSRVSKVTPADISRVSRRLFKDDHSCLVIVGVQRDK